MDHALSGEHARRRRRRRALALTTVALALAVTVGAFALGNTGGASLSVTLPEGSFNGAVGEIAALSSKVTAPKGNAQLDTGVALGRVVVAWKEADHIQVRVAWTNVVETIKKVLLNPNAQISIGLYEPIHENACSGATETTADKANEVESPYVTITDEYGTNNETKQTLCGELAKSAEGSGSVSSAGKLLLTRQILTGDLEPKDAGSDAQSACTASTTSWCRPASLGGEEKRDALYLVASIVVPGGVPHGQQPPEAAALNFFEHLKRV